MARLPEAVEIMLASLTKAEAELDWISGQLEEDFATVQASGIPNIGEMVRRLHRLKYEVSTLSNHCKELLELKQECLQAMNSQLTLTMEKLERVEEGVGLDGALLTEERNASVAELQATL